MKNLVKGIRSWLLVIVDLCVSCTCDLASRLMVIMAVCCFFCCMGVSTVILFSALVCVLIANTLVVCVLYCMSYIPLDID